MFVGDFMTFEDSEKKGGEAGTGEEVLEVVEIEEYGKRNERPPLARSYRIRIDKHKYTVHSHHITGRQLLELAGKVPVDCYEIYQKLHGGYLKKIGLNETVDLHACGVERFQTVPLHETEG